MKAASTAARPAATKQTLAPVQKNQMVDKPIKYQAGGKDVELSIALTQAYFCPQASPAEAFVFNSWCAHNGLDPWKREAYKTYKGQFKNQNFINRLKKVSPYAIIRDGRASNAPGASKYARQILGHYNYNAKDRLPDLL